MKFSIEILTDNDAFGFTHEMREKETANILRRVIETLEFSGYSEPRDFRNPTKILDSNGNFVGFFSFTE